MSSESKRVEKHTLTMLASLQRTETSPMRLREMGVESSKVRKGQGATSLKGTNKAFSGLPSALADVITKRKLQSKGLSTERTDQFLEALRLRRRRL
jgi:hypothetical protein